MGTATEDVAARAGKWQGSGAYPGVDDWASKTIMKGTKVWGGAPGQSNFYTTEEVMQLNLTKGFKLVKVPIRNLEQA